MKTKLLSLLFLTIAYFGFSQSKGIIGEFSSWISDVDFVDNGNDTFTLSNYYFPAGEVKFRENDLWDVNWGTDPNNLEFPTGILNENGANIIISAAGFYDVTLDFNDNFFTFTEVPETDQSIGLVGDFNNWMNDLTLTTTDFTNYTAQDVVITDGLVKLRRNGNWTVGYGGIGLEGVAIVNGEDIAISAGSYDISFNLITLEYAFTLATLSNTQFTSTEITASVVNNTLKISGYNGNASIKVYSILGQLLSSRSFNINTSFTTSLELPKKQISIVVIEGENILKTLKVLSK